MNDEEFIASVIKAREESVSYFSNARKQERERWVVNEFLSNLGFKLSESDVISSPDEPPDVFFAEARFEVKEIMDQGKRRHAEYKESLRKAKEAKVPADLFESYTPRDITYAELCQMVVEHLAKVRTYAPAVQEQLDLLFYVNLEKVHGYVSSELVAASDLQQCGWRSVSFVAGPMAVVLYASESSPPFLHCKQGKVTRHNAGET